MTMSKTNGEVSGRRHLPRWELLSVGIEPDAEVGSIGRLRTSRRVFEFFLGPSERWVGSVSSGSPLSLEEATALDLAAYGGARTRLSGARGVLGDVARWQNCHHGMAPSESWGAELRKQYWVFDTLEALDAFVRKVREMEREGAVATVDGGETVSAPASAVDRKALEDAWERGRQAGIAEAAERAAAFVRDMLLGGTKGPVAR